MGGFGIETGITFKTLGKGLSNTNSLIEMNLQPDTLDWPVLWSKVEEFRSMHSNDWFIPSANELSLIYFKKSILNNLSTTTLAYYWSSSEESKDYKFIIFFGSGNETSSLPISHTRRARLCFYL